ncbi:transcriptional regulator with XRE-family HTH domain [Chryseobacterium rhizosphaerae]|uniref:helix-turn-helix domain-containing protein n=1 Tax=Chryseobacterium rhizosphaerae TaxID=395937 RepID=UPI00285E5315|nr:helix-turn-helix domain-containing protein [Chryseobacterium rhizosphaerae]MDR6548350.1 transcriptional regulator with XRE-family HTH domain [Chryseobacterium rhizosphaerae]
MNGKTLKQKRKAIKLTQTQLAHNLGVSMRTIQNWEGDINAIPKIVEVYFNNYTEYSQFEQLKQDLEQKKEGPYNELPIEEKLNVLYKLWLEYFMDENESGNDIKKVNRTIHGLVSKDAHQDKYIIFMRDKILELEKSLEIQQEMTRQILEIVKDLKLTTH